jgi:hypothetical protein
MPTPSRILSAEGIYQRHRKHLTTFINNYTFPLWRRPHVPNGNVKMYWMQPKQFHWILMQNCDCFFLNNSNFFCRKQYYTKLFEILIVNPPLPLRRIFYQNCKNKLLGIYWLSMLIVLAFINIHVQSILRFSMYHLI